MEELLFLCHRIPYPPDKGDKIRAWHMLRHLARRYRVRLGCFVDDAADRAHVATLQQVCAEVFVADLTRPVHRLRALASVSRGRPLTLSWFRDAGLQRWVDGVVTQHRPVRALAFSAAMASFLDRARGVLPCVLDMVDVDSEKFAEYASRSSGPKRLVWRREARTLLSFERRAAAAFAATLFVSREEAQRFLKLAPESASRVSWVENGVDLARFTPEASGTSPYAGDEDVIAFTGTMSYWPNIDAATWFASEILPLIRAERPRVRFVIVGASPAPAVVRLASLPGVVVTGRVADTRPYVGHASLVVAPLRVARGIQNKVLEAMAMARPVVATTAAFEGLRADPGSDLLLADTAAEIARASLDVLAGRHPGLGRAARDVVEREYAWEARLQELDRVLDAASIDARAA